MEQLGRYESTHNTTQATSFGSVYRHMQAQKKGRDILMAFEEDIGTALAKACEFDTDSDAIHLARAAKIVRNHMFGKAKPFTGFPTRFCAISIACSSEYDSGRSQHPGPM